MIEYLAGKVLRRLPSGVILDVGGVGYGLTMPLSAVAALPGVGEALAVWVYTRVREDAFQLYGFMSRDERLTFEILIQINGVGPKVAIAILSTLSLGSLREAVEAKQAESFQMVPGIGKRTAEKIILELAARLERLPFAPAVSSMQGGRRGGGLGLGFERGSGRGTWSAAMHNDLKSALANLGFKEKDITPLLAKLAESYQGEDFPELVRKALALVGEGQKIHKRLKKPTTATTSSNKAEVDVDDLF